MSTINHPATRKARTEQPVPEQFPELYLTTHPGTGHRWSCGTCGATSPARSSEIAAWVDGMGHMDFKHAAHGVRRIDVEPEVDVDPLCRDCDECTAVPGEKCRPHCTSVETL